MALTKVTGQVIKNTTDVTVGVLTVTNTLAVGGTVSIGGTLTYEDVTNVDAVGLITARNGIVVGSGITLSKDGDVFFTGIATGNGSGLTALNASNLASGTVPTARLGSGTASSSTFLRGDSTFAAVTSTTINNNANNRVITGSGTANTLEGEANLTFDGTELKIGGDSSVAGTFGLEIYNTDSNEGTALIAGTAGARLDIMDTGSSERIRISAAGAAYFISYKSGDPFIFQTTDGSGTAERLRIDSTGAIVKQQFTATNTYAANDTTQCGYQAQNLSDTTNTYAALRLTAGSSSPATAQIASIRTGTGQNDLTFQLESSNTAFEALRITSDGNLNINSSGLSSPYSSYRHISVNNNLILNAANSAGGFAGMQNNAYLNSSGSWVRVNNDHATSIGTDDGVFYFRNAAAGTGAITWSQPLTILANGNIGINRTNPDMRLNVNGVAEFNSYDNTGGGGSYYTAKGFMIGNAYDAGKSSSVTDDRNSIIWNERGLDVDFATADALRMKLSYDGHVFFSGMTSLTASSTNKGVVIEQSSNNGRINLHANSGAGTAAGILFYHSGSHVGGINYTSSATIYNTSSDYRLKENATTISDGITRLKTLKPYRFNFKIDPSKTVDGFFAHEVTAVPEAVQGEKDEVDSDNNPVYQGIDQSKLVPLLTAALQEAITKIETLETKVAALEG